jgi:DNA gyrase subunit B
VVHTVLHAGGKFGGGGYKVSGGLHGVGVSVVNALSESMQVESARDGKVWRQEYERGKPIGRSSRSARRTAAPALRRLSSRTPRSSKRRLQLRRIAQRVRESAYLNKGCGSRCVDERETPSREKSFYFEGGVVSFVRHLNKGRDVLHDRRSTSSGARATRRSRSRCSTTMATARAVFSFANNINTVDGGTHITGFRAALTSSLNEYARKNAILREADGNPLW